MEVEENNPGTIYRNKHGIQPAAVEGYGLPDVRLRPATCDLNRCKRPFKVWLIHESIQLRLLN